MYRSYEKRERPNHIHLYLSDQEKLILEKKLEASGLRNMSDFLRRMIIFGDVFIPDFADVREMNYLLGKLGNNINQIAKKANTYDEVTQKDISDIKEMMNRLWQSQKSILSKLHSVDLSAT